MRIRKKTCAICVLACALVLVIVSFFPSLMGQSASQQPTPVAGGVDSKGQPLPPTLEDYRAARGKAPLIYSPEYNIGFWGMENLHPFDSKKYMKVYDALVTDKKLLTPSQLYAPAMATDAQLSLVHTPEYLKSLESSATVAAITEVPPVGWLSAATARTRVLVPMLYATGGSILGAVLAYEGPNAPASASAATASASASAAPPVASATTSSAATAAAAPVAGGSADSKDEKKAAAVAPTAGASGAVAGTNGFGWAINLSGGYHHACGHSGGGFCVYADISIAILAVAKRNPTLKKFMIVDLDAHQGNGHENDKRVGVFDAAGVSVYTMDMYNAHIYPRDTKAKKYIDCRVELKPYTADDEYLRLERENLDRSLKAFRPQFLVYNAGTDCLEGDPLGQLSVSASGIVKRDEIVFELARQHHVPVLMLLSGGYQKSNAAVIAQSIENLNTKFNLFQTALAQSSGTTTTAPATSAAASASAAATAAAPAAATTAAPPAATAAPPTGAKL